MKEIMQLHANYNKVVNERMIEILKKLSEEDFNKDLGLYYKSIKGVFEHYLATDGFVYANIFAKYSNKSLDTSHISNFINPDWSIKEEISKDRNKLFEARNKLDSFIVLLVENISDFSKIEVLKFSEEAKFQKPIYNFIISLLTHNIHHRGQIAAALDILGVENDFPGMLTV